MWQRFFSQYWLRLAQWIGIATGVVAILLNARVAGKQSERNAQHETALKTRSHMDAVPYPRSDDVSKRLREGKF